MYRDIDMGTGKRLEVMDISREHIAGTVRALRNARHLTQADLARQLGLSQSRLSEIERGAGSFTAEQFLTILKLFNVGTSEFVASTADRESEVQKALVRLGAIHLNESSETFPSEDLENVADVVRETLVEGSPRLVTALAPVLVRNIDRLNLTRVHQRLLDLGLERRLAWLVENTLEAVQGELAESLPKGWARRCRRATVIFSSFLGSAVAAHTARASGSAVPDVLDVTIRSKKTLAEVSASSSATSRKWGIVTGLQPEDFAKALRAARDAD
jgi:transcriptional regulator with XRE-family HTH domain